MTSTETRTSTPTANQVAPRAEGTTHVRGVDLSWTTEGDAALTVWVHGMTNDRWALENAGLYDWSPVVSAGNRLVRYDPRGHGQSQGRPAPQDYRWTNLADDLLALLDHVSPGQPVQAMGSSSGTATLIFAALRAPSGSARSSSPRRPPRGRHAPAKTTSTNRGRSSPNTTAARVRTAHHDPAAHGAVPAPT